MLARWNDWAPLSRFSNTEARDPLEAFRRELGRWFLEYDRGTADHDVAAGHGYPRTTLEDTGGAFVLRAEVPGLSEKQLELNVDGSSITLKGERETAAPEGHSVHRRERGAFRFARSFALPTKVDAEKVEAVLKHGVLTVTVAKAQEAQARKIEVRVS